MQFSIVPWQYDREVAELAREYVRIHEEIVTPIVLQAATEYNTTGMVFKKTEPFQHKGNSILHRNSTVARRVTNATSEHYGDP